MPTKITDLTIHDIRFPTSRALDGSDAMNPAPDYSATYVVLKTNSPQGLAGHGLTFTIGRGNEICVTAVKSLAALVVGATLEEIFADMSGFWRYVTAGDSQLRWLGPEKGAIHLATAAIVNGVWDLWAKFQGKPVWKLLVDMSPQELVRCMDFRYVTDALAPDEAISLLEANAPTKAARERQMRESGFPAYTTSAGWLGYSDQKVRRLAREGVAAGWTHFKQKVGGNIEEDVRSRSNSARGDWLGARAHDGCKPSMGCPGIIQNIRRLAEFKPWWGEEPTSPDDILGHASIRKQVAPIGVATGEHCQNRVMFKQFLQAKAIDFCQIDSARLGGLNEVMIVLLMASKFGVPVCPHAGGVGLCEYVQHISLFDYICVSASLEGRVLEYVDHLHDHFLDPVVIRNGHYMPPEKPGYSIALRPETLEQFNFPNGPAWKNRRNEQETFKIERSA